MKIQQDIKLLHPMMPDIIKRIQSNVIDKHKAPFRIFETGRDKTRHNTLLQRGKTKDILSKHLYNLENKPPLYATAIDYVYFTGKWSWNLRDNTIQSWYLLFGNLVLDACPELDWGGLNRSSTNYTHFSLRRYIVIANLDKIPCTVPLQ